MTSGPECHKIGRTTAIKETGVPSPPPAPERRDTGCKRAPAGEAKTVPQRGWKHPRPAPRNRSPEGPLGLNLGGTTKQACSRPKPGDGSIFFAPAAFWRTVERLILHSKFAGAAQHFLLLLQKKTLAKEKEPEGISISPQTPLNRPEKSLRFFWTFPAIV